MGSVRRPNDERGSRGWEARYRDHSGRQRSRTFRTKREAERFLERVGADLQRGDWLDPTLQRTKFGEWAEEWRASIVHLEPNTIAFYDTMLRHHVLPAFAERAVGTIDQAVMRRFVAELVAAGAGARTVQGAFQTVRHVMTTAQGSGAIKANPCDRVKLPRLGQRECVFLTPEQVLELADAIRPPYGVLVTFAAYSGLRAGEIGGLRVGRLDLLRRQVAVVEALKDVNGRLSFGPTKNHGRRTVRLPPFLCELLGGYLADRANRANDLVFAAPEGGPLQHRVFYRRYFRPAIEAAGLPAAVRFHDLRHTCAAFLIAQGAHPRAIMERLGHSSITVTLNTYGHLFPSLDEALTDGLEATYRTSVKTRTRPDRHAASVSDLRPATVR
ncbi:MAG TPA: tyrosine-type recombinase/integrase [Acidimicrobiales bacterium]|nr:tyrosine-type recombinase/integrase [Acidimicrobiales bacterium]